MRKKSIERLNKKRITLKGLIFSDPYRRYFVRIFKRVYGTRKTINEEND